MISKRTTDSESKKKSREKFEEFLYAKFSSHFDVLLEELKKMLAQTFQNVESSSRRIVKVKQCVKHVDWKEW